MSKTFVLLYVLMMGLTAGAQPELESLAKSEMLNARQMLNAYGKRSSAAKINIIHAQLMLEPDMNTARITRAYADFTFFCGEDLSTLDFDLRSELKVDSVVFEGSLLPFNHFNHLLLLAFPNTLNTGEKHRVRIYYSGQPDMSSRAYFRNVNASGPSISTLSQPYGASYWWPCRDNLTDKIDSLDMHLRVDTPYTAVSNGVLVNTLSEGSKRSFFFRHRYPIAAYLVAVTFARYNAFTQTAMLPSLGKDIDVVNYVFPHNDLNLFKSQAAETAGIMYLFDSLLGSYPFHKEQYGHAQFAWSGGMEHQTMSFMVNFNYDLIAHELAHQWFGDKVTCGSWKDIWLNEGFATYCNLLCYNTPARDEEWLARLRKNKSEVMALTSGSVFAYDTGNVSKLFDYRLSYQKGALVLHQLRWLIGDKAFFGALREYHSDTGLAYGFARQNDLKRIMEKHANADLSDYFNDWVMGEGYPEYDIRWGQKGNTLGIEISQRPSHASVPVFNVPLPVLVKGDVKDSLIRIDIDALQTMHEIKLGFKVKSLQFDPREWLLAKASVKFPAASESELVSVYPNPFNGRFYVSLAEAEIGSWSMYDLCGQMVEYKDLYTYLPAGSILEINAEALAAGIYVLKIETPGLSILRKIIKTD